jgi:hypothetical protein
MAHRLIPLTPPLFFHFTLPLSTMNTEQFVSMISRLPNYQYTTPCVCQMMVAEACSVGAGRV